MEKGKANELSPFFCDNFNINASKYSWGCLIKNIPFIGKVSNNKMLKML
jgi:hypothetical protein